MKMISESPVKQISQYPFPYFLLDLNANIISCSGKARQQFGDIDDLSDIINRNELAFYDHLSQDDTDVPIELMLRTVAGFKPFNVFKQISGPKRIELFCIPIDNQSKAMKQTIDELKRHIHDIEKRVQEDQHLVNIGKMAANFVHEVRNPLTTVKGFVQLLQSYTEDDTYNKYADVALEELDRANQIIGEFLCVSKPSDQERTVVSVCQLVKNTIILCESVALNAKCVLDYQLPVEHVNVKVNTQQIKQVLVNMIKNAVEATSENASDTHGEINIHTKINRGFIHIYINDNGAGMDQSTLNYIFKPFYTTKSSGTGLGLSVCKDIIEEHGGSVTAESQLGIGTCFIISLPILHRQV
ncbi:two-component system sensor histidine kinase NtrB [Tuberibacillus sp. Marseille-P3662]|uniref:two-component system sensor histidine kinase NtrB n=1 Tax=Tuberibacillus sp. Marseille-P3662 TaxID=1965358 RepID=UPI000A1CEDF4|nr:ATP-binding protein [Tuberibacillus sp. Marseille-P3662]